MNREKDKAKEGAMIGKIIFEVIKFLITAFIITNIVNIILMGALVPCFSKKRGIKMTACKVGTFKLFCSGDYNCFSARQRVSNFFVAFAAHYYNISRS